MPARNYSSIAEAKTLSTGINSSVTSMTLNSVTTLPGTYPYTLVIDPDTAYEEIVSVTASAGGTVLTITRGQDGTSAQSHNAAAVIRHMITARDLQEPQNHIYASTSVHGVTGAVVGTTDTQTLSAKTLSSPTITGTVTGTGVISSTNILDGTIVNADINSSAAIVATKLTGTTAEFNTALSDNNFATIAGTETLTAKTLTSPTITSPTISGTITGAVITSANIVDGTIVDADINAGAAIAQSKVSGLTTDLGLKAPLNNPTFTGTVTLPTGTVTTGMILDGTIVNADINASAAIVASKLTGTTAEFNGALSDNDFATLAGAETLTNKTLTYPVINGNSGNTKIGSFALHALTTGINNTALGSSALDSMTSGEDNVAIGAGTLGQITTSVGNVAVGFGALSSATSGQLNTAVGSDSAPSITTGSNNTILGYNGAISLTTGSNNTVIGYNANTSTATVSNQVVLGNSSITDLRCQDTTISAPSDIRDKTDVQPIPVGLDFINDIRPVNFEWNMRDGGQVGNRQGGFIAQEVLAVEQQYNTRNWLGMVNDENPDQLVLAPAKLIPVMVKALQELSEQVEELKAKVAELEAK